MTALAQPVEDLAVLGPRFQPFGIELPELAVGFVAIGEPLVRAEIGDGSGDAVQCAVVGGDLAGEFALRGFERCGVVGDQCGGAIQGYRHQVIGAPLATDKNVHALAIDAAGCERGDHGCALARLQEFNLACTHILTGKPIDGAHISRVGPIDAAICRAEPDGDRQRLEQGAGKLGILGNPGAALLFVLERVTQGRLVGNAQHCIGTTGEAGNLQGAACQRRDVSLSRR